MLKKKENISLFISVVFFIYLLIIDFLIFNKEEKVTTIFLITTFTTLFFIALYSISKNFYRVILIISFIIIIPYFGAIQLFGKIGYPNIAALYFTDSTESLSYLSIIPFGLVVKSILLFIPLALFWKPNFFSFPKKMALISILILFSFTGYKIFTQWEYLTNQKDTNYFYKTVYISPFRIASQFIGTLYLVDKDVKKQTELQKFPHSWKIKSNPKSEKITVVVIGESVRKDFMQIYNPQLQNTPFLANATTIKFNNVISFGAHTLESLSYALQEKKAGKPYFPNNAVTLSKALGYKTFWISNQGIVGQHDSQISAMGKQANYTYFVSKGSYVSAQSDDEILKIFRSKLSNSESPIYFLHTIGSHPAPCSITKGEYQKFVQSKQISCYIESIRRTDEFLKKIYQNLSRTGKEFQIIYFSDHGLQLTDDGNLIHHEDYKQNYDVPLLIIDSSLNSKISINANRNLRDFLLLYEQLLQVKTDNIINTYNFISEDIDPHAFEIYNNQNYKKLKDNTFKLKKNK